MWRHFGQFQFEKPKRFVISRSQTPARRDLVIEDVKFGKKDCGLYRVKPAVHADADVMVSPVLSVPGDLTDDPRKLGIRGEDRPPVAVTTEGLGRKEAGGGDGAQRTGLPAPILWAASSITISPCRSAIALMASKSAHWP